tara:strand:+ start:42 stop:452 length:411 start_codon:yes stop_codon:yes gene_type:complete
MLVDRIIFLYAAIGCYMFFLFAIHSEKCPNSTGFYIFFSLISIVTRPYYELFKLKDGIESSKNEILFNIYLDLGSTIYGIVEINRFCVNDIIMWWLVGSVGNHVVFIIPQFFLLRRKNNLLQAPLISNEQETYIDI